MLGLRAVVIGVALALLAASCGDDDGGSTDTATTTTAASTTTVDDGGSGSGETTTTEATTAEPEPLTASWKGVTEDTVNIGVSILDFDALKDLGLQDFGWGDQRLIWEFYIEQLNARGGVAGRQVDAALDFYNPALALEAEAACLRMTQDREAFAVLGSFLGPAESATPCLTDQEDLVVVGGTMTVELLEGSNSVWVGNGVADRRRIPAFFTLLEEGGYVSGQKVAVVSGDEDEDNTNDVVIPILEGMDVEIVLTKVNTSSEDDVLAEDRFWDLTSEQIRAEQAEVIVINGDTSGAIRGIGNNGLEQELWVVNSGQLTNLGSTVDRSDADGALAFGSASAEETWEEPNLVACVKEFTDAHPDIDVLGPLEVAEGAERWDTGIALACGWIAVFETLMNASDPAVTPATVQAAYENYGDTMLPGQFFGSWGPGKPDANDGFRLSVFDSTVGENGTLVPLTELLDATP